MPVIKVMVKSVEAHVAMSNTPTGSEITVKVPAVRVKSGNTSCTTELPTRGMSAVNRRMMEDTVPGDGGSYSSDVLVNEPREGKSVMMVTGTAPAALFADILKPVEVWRIPSMGIDKPICAGTMNVVLLPDTIAWVAVIVSVKVL